MDDENAPGVWVPRRELDGHREVVGDYGVTPTRCLVEARDANPSGARYGGRNAELLRHQRHVVPEALELSSHRKCVCRATPEGGERLPAEHDLHPRVCTSDLPHRGGGPLVRRVALERERPTRIPLEARDLVFAQRVAPAADTVGLRRSERPGDHLRAVRQAGDAVPSDRDGTHLRKPLVGTLMSKQHLWGELELEEVA